MNLAAYVGFSVGWMGAESAPRDADVSEHSYREIPVTVVLVFEACDVVSLQILLKKNYYNY